MDDLVSDFSAIHGIRDIRTLTGPAFFRMAFRLAAYEGVIRARFRAAHQRQEQSSPSPQRSLYGPDGGGQREVVPATKAALQAHPEMSRMFSFGTAPRQK